MASTPDYDFQRAIVASLSSETHVPWTHAKESEDPDLLRAIQNSLATLREEAIKRQEAIEAFQDRPRLLRFPLSSDAGEPTDQGTASASVGTTILVQDAARKAYCDPPPSEVMEINTLLARRDWFGHKDFPTDDLSYTCCRKAVKADGNCQFLAVLYASGQLMDDVKTYVPAPTDALRISRAGYARTGKSLLTDRNDLLKVRDLRRKVCDHLYATLQKNEDLRIMADIELGGKDKFSLITYGPNGAMRIANGINDTWGGQFTLQAYCDITQHHILQFHTDRSLRLLSPTGFDKKGQVATTRSWLSEGGDLRDLVDDYILILYKYPVHYETVGPPESRPTRLLVAFMHHCGTGRERTDSTSWYGGGLVRYDEIKGLDTATMIARIRSALGDHPS